MRSPRSRAHTAAVLLVGATLLLSGCVEERATPSPTDTSSTVVSPTPASYHVDCEAPEAGDGTAQRPWNTLDAVTAHGAFLPGERLLLKRDSVCSGRLTPTGSGTNGDPIVLGAYGVGDAPEVGIQLSDRKTAAT